MNNRANRLDHNRSSLAFNEGNDNANNNNNGIISIQQYQQEQAKRLERIKETWYHCSPPRLYDLCIDVLVKNINLILVKAKPNVNKLKSSSTNKDKKLCKTSNANDLIDESKKAGSFKMQTEALNSELDLKDYVTSKKLKKCNDSEQETSIALTRTSKNLKEIKNTKRKSKHHRRSKHKKPKLKYTLADHVGPLPNCICESLIKKYSKFYLDQLGKLERIEYFQINRKNSKEKPQLLSGSNIEQNDNDKMIVDVASSMSLFSNENSAMPDVVTESKFSFNIENMRKLFNVISYYDLLMALVSRPDKANLKSIDYRQCIWAHSTLEQRLIIRLQNQLANSELTNRPLSELFVSKYFHVSSSTSSLSLLRKSKKKSKTYVNTNANANANANVNMNSNSNSANNNNHNTIKSKSSIRKIKSLRSKQPVHLNDNDLRLILKQQCEYIEICPCNLTNKSILLLNKYLNKHLKYLRFQNCCNWQQASSQTAANPNIGLNNNNNNNNINLIGAGGRLIRNGHNQHDDNLNDDEDEILENFGENYEIEENDDEFNSDNDEENDNFDGAAAGSAGGDGGSGELDDNDEENDFGEKEHKNYYIKNIRSYFNNRDSNDDEIFENEFNSSDHDQERDKNSAKASSNSGINFDELKINAKFKNKNNQLNDEILNEEDFEDEDDEDEDDEDDTGDFDAYLQEYVNRYEQHQHQRNNETKLEEIIDESEETCKLNNQSQRHHRHHHHNHSHHHHHHRHHHHNNQNSNKSHHHHHHHHNHNHNHDQTKHRHRRCSKQHKRTNKRKHHHKLKFESKKRCEKFPNEEFNETENRFDALENGVGSGQIGQSNRQSNRNLNNNNDLNAKSSNDPCKLFKPNLNHKRRRRSKRHKQKKKNEGIENANSTINSAKQLDTQNQSELNTKNECDNETSSILKWIVKCAVQNTISNSTQPSTSNQAAASSASNSGTSYSYGGVEGVAGRASAKTISSLNDNSNNRTIPNNNTNKGKPINSEFPSQSSTISLIEQIKQKAAILAETKMLDKVSISSSNYDDYDLNNFNEGGQQSHSNRVSSINENEKTSQTEEKFDQELNDDENLNDEETNKKNSKNFSLTNSLFSSSSSNSSPSFSSSTSLSSSSSSTSLSTFSSESSASSASSFYSHDQSAALAKNKSNSTSSSIYLSYDQDDENQENPIIGNCASYDELDENDESSQSSSYSTLSTCSSLSSLSSSLSSLTTTSSSSSPCSSSSYFTSSSSECYETCKKTPHRDNYNLNQEGKSKRCRRYCNLNNVQSDNKPKLKRKTTSAAESSSRQLPSRSDQQQTQPHKVNKRFIRQQRLLEKVANLGSSPINVIQAIAAKALNFKLKNSVSFEQVAAAAAAEAAAAAASATAANSANNVRASNIENSNEVKANSSKSTKSDYEHKNYNNQPNKNLSSKYNRLLRQYRFFKSTNINKKLPSSSDRPTTSKAAAQIDELNNEMESNLFETLDEEQDEDSINENITNESKNRQTENSSLKKLNSKLSEANNFYETKHKKTKRVNENEYLNESKEGSKFKPELNSSPFGKDVCRENNSIEEKKLLEGKSNLNDIEMEQKQQQQQPQQNIPSNLFSVLKYWMSKRVEILNMTNSPTSQVTSKQQSSETNSNLTNRNSQETCRKSPVSSIEATTETNGGILAEATTSNSNLNQSSTANKRNKSSKLSLTKTNSISSLSSSSSTTSESFNSIKDTFSINSANMINDEQNVQMETNKVDLIEINQMESHLTEDENMKNLKKLKKLIKTEVNRQIEDSKSSSFKKKSKEPNEENIRKSQLDLEDENQIKKKLKSLKKKSYFDKMNSLSVETINLSNLQHLSLRNLGVNVIDVEILNGLLKNLKSLRYLDISNCCTNQLFTQRKPGASNNMMPDAYKQDQVARAFINKLKTESENSKELVGRLDGLLSLKETLTHLIMADLSVDDIQANMGYLLRLKSLRHLDVSNCREKLPLNSYKNASLQLAKIVYHLNKLTSLDISGTNLGGPIIFKDADEVDYIRGRLYEDLIDDFNDYQRVKLNQIETIKSGVSGLMFLNNERKMLDFLGCFCCDNSVSSRANLPAIRIAGEESEKHLFTSLETYLNDRPLFLLDALNHLFELYRDELIEDKLLGGHLIMNTMEKHLDNSRIQISGSASLFYVLKYWKEENIQLPHFYLKRLIQTVINGMEEHIDESAMRRNCVLIMCRLNLPDDVLFVSDRLIRILLKIFDDYIEERNKDPNNDRPEHFVLRTAMHLLNILACSVHGHDKSTVGSMAIPVAMDLIKTKIKFKEPDDILEVTWSFLWNITDETPENCRIFLDNCDGMGAFMDCIQFKKAEITRNMMGLLGNVAEVKPLRNRLCKNDYISTFRQLLFHTNDGIEIPYNSAGVLVHIMSDGPDAWLASQCKNHERSNVIEDIETAIDKWDLKSERNINYRSFEPIFRLVNEYQNPICQRWACWALANLTTVYHDIYCPLFEKENGRAILDRIISNPNVNDAIKNFAQIVLQNANNRLMK